MTNDRHTPWDPEHSGESAGGPTGQTPGPGQDGFQPDGTQHPGYHNQPPYARDPQQPPHAQGHGAPYGGPGGAGYGQPPYDPYGGGPDYRDPKGQGSRAPLWIALGVLVVLVIGALIYFLTRGDDDSEDARPQPSPTAIDNDSNGENGGREADNDPEEFGDPNADPATFRSGMEDILAESGLDREAAEEQGITPEQWDAYLTCVTEEAIQRLRPEAIDSISNGIDVYDDHSVTELEDIAMQCGEEAGTL